MPWARVAADESCVWSWMGPLSLPLISHGTLSKPLQLSQLRFPVVWNEEANACLSVSWWGLNALVEILACWTCLHDLPFLPSEPALNKSRSTGHPYHLKTQELEFWTWDSWSCGTERGRTRTRIDCLLWERHSSRTLLDLINHLISNAQAKMRPRE